MLFYISEEVVIEAERGDDNIVRIIDDLATSVFYGRHILYCNLPLLKRLSSVTLFANRTLAVLNFIYSHYPDWGGVIDKIKTHIYLINEGNDIIISSEGSAQIIKLPMILINDDSIFSSTILLFENIKDSNLYDIVLKYYKRVTGLISCSHAYKSSAGGGNCTYEAYSGYIEHKNICLCIVDSDKKYPAADKGETFSKIYTVEKRNDWLLCKLISLENCREIENMIPFKLLKDVVKTDPQLKEVFSIHEKFESVNSLAPLFFDLKDGFSVCSYKKISKSNYPYLNFIERIFIKSELLTEEVLENYNSLEIEDNGAQKIYEGFGAKIVIKAADFIMENKIKLEDSMFLKEQKEEWLSIGRYLMDWTCALQPIRS